MVTIGIIATPLGYLIHWIYELVSNYGVAIILFTVIIKIILAPFGVSQQKMSVKLSQIQPLINDINKKYKNDKEKLSTATMELYKKYDINPMSGCLPLLLQFPILIGLYSVIQQPLTYILRLPADVISQKLAPLGEAAANNRTGEILAAAKEGLINFNFLGIDLSQTPNFREPSLLWIIPIMATLVTFLTPYVTKKLNGTPQGGDANNSMMNSMNVVMPVMTLFITFTLPAGIGLYWFISSALSIVQQILLTLYFKKKYVIDISDAVKAGKKKKSSTTSTKQLPPLN